MARFIVFILVAMTPRFNHQYCFSQKPHLSSESHGTSGFVIQLSDSQNAGR